eukprot:2862188-Rhodomonas_salina.2
MGSARCKAPPTAAAPRVRGRCTGRAARAQQFNPGVAGGGRPGSRYRAASTGNQRGVTVLSRNLRGRIPRRDTSSGRG